MRIRNAVATLESSSPYSQSRSYDSEIPSLNRERKDEYEKRTWRHKCHTTPDGNIFIPAMSFKLALDRAAEMLSIQIPGKGKKTFTQFFRAGVLCTESLVLPTKQKDVDFDRIFANADGKRGSGKRVWRLFPRVDSWEGKVVFNVLADEIGEDTFQQHLEQTGAFVGIGRFRPEKGGFYGRFRVNGIQWE